MVFTNSQYTYMFCLCTTGESFQGSNPHSLPVYSRMADGGDPLDGGRQIIIQKAWPWTLVGNLFGECHASYTLMTSFVILKKSRRIVALTKDDIFRPYPLFILFSRLIHLFPHFYIHLTYHWTCSRFKYS